MHVGCLVVLHCPSSAPQRRTILFLRNCRYTAVLIDATDNAFSMILSKETPQRERPRSRDISPMHARMI